MTEFKKELYIGSAPKPGKTAWATLVAKYQTPNSWKSIGQAGNSFIPFKD